MRQNTNGRGTSWISLLLFWSTIQTLYKADWLLDTYMLYRIGYWACWVRSSNIAERNEPQSKDSLEKVNLFYFTFCESECRFPVFLHSKIYSSERETRQEKLLPNVLFGTLFKNKTKSQMDQKTLELVLKLYWKAEVRSQEMTMLSRIILVALMIYCK